MTMVDDVIRIARSQVGYHEGRSSDGHWNNVEKYAGEVPGLAWANGQAWCAVFNCWLDYSVGLVANVHFPLTASVAQAVAWFTKQGRTSTYPAIGAWILYRENGVWVHTGRVVAYDATTVTTVEGNTNTNGSSEGDGVYLKVHQRSDPRVALYGYPAFPGGIMSADPAWAHQNPVVKVTRGPRVDAAIAAARKVIQANADRPNSIKYRAAKAALKSLKAVPARRVA